jgi:mannitol/fructose-specific phosphotransferase system IIA component (Ntr-type)
VASQPQGGATVKGLLGFISEQVISLELKARDKDTAIVELLDILVSSGKVKDKDKDALKAAILDRERLGSTGIGAGLAIPHVKQSALVSELVGAFARSRTGVSWSSSDGEPCFVFFLMVSPKQDMKAQTEHLQILKKLASLARSEHFVRFLKQASTKQEVQGILQEVEAS